MTELDFALHSVFERILLMNLKQYEAIHSKLFNVEYSLIRLQMSEEFSTEFGVPLLATRVWLGWRFRLFTVKLNSSWDLDQGSRISESQAGPFHYKLCEANFEDSIPREMTSARLSLERTWCQYALGNRVWISKYLFATKKPKGEHSQPLLGKIQWTFEPVVQVRTQRKVLRKVCIAS